MSSQPVTRMTTPTLAVLAALFDGEDWYGARIAKVTAMRIGTVYPILARLEQAGWVTSSWEKPDEEKRAGARRRYYRLTPHGRECTLAALRSREKSAVSRETLGRLVRQVWTDWAIEQPDPKPSWLIPWEDLDDGQREVDMRIGEALFERGVLSREP